MKILWIISSGWKEGGAENYLVLLKPELEKLGHEVRIFAGDDRQDMPHFNDYNFRVYRGVLGLLGSTVNVSAYRALQKVLSDYQPDIVHFHTIGHASPFILFALRGHPALFTLHGPEGFLRSLLLWCFPEKYFRTKGDPQRSVHMCRDLRFIGKVRLLYHRIITDPMYARGLKNIDRFIAPSVYMKDIAERDGFTSIVIPNGTTLFSESPKDVKDCTRTLAFGGRLEKGKGVDVLLRAFARTLAVFPDARLIVAGDGRERESLVSLAADLGVSQKVEFLGHVDRAALEGVYQRADVAVMPSVWTEAFGLAGIEALSVGRPVIASSVGGIPEWLIDGETGYLVTPGDPDALYAAIKKIFSDPERLVQMMKTSRSRAEEFGIDVHAKKIAALYADLLRKKRKIV